MKIPAITNTQQKPAFNGNFVYDELNLLPKQLHEVKIIAKNFNISKKPYDISIYNDPRDSFLVMVAEGQKVTDRVSVSVSPEKQRPKILDESVSNLIDTFDKKFFEQNSLKRKFKKVLSLINPFTK